jgi:hypothetical protein
MTVFICDPEPEHKIGRPRKHKDRITTSLERSQEHKAKAKKKRHENIAILDTETDPFDNSPSGRKRKVLPFLAVLYSDNFETIVIWENDFKRWVEKVVAAILSLPDEYTIYAHNGGRFDFMFLISEMRGSVSFKGRGIMDARIGPHHLRDSFHLIPEKLAAYQKDAFDYTKLKRCNREKYKQEAIAYCISDCRYLLDLVKKFIADFGLKLSIGQAAMATIKKFYTVERFSDGWDNYIRDFFFGGRVECLKGRGHFVGAYKLYDVNSMYPAVMRNYQHPIGAMGDYKLRRGVPSNDTVFVDLSCDNRGALIARSENGETTANITRGRFKTTIWEYQAALELNLISNVVVHFSLDCAKRTDFKLFVDPLYQNRIALKEFMRELKASGQELSARFVEAKKDDMFYKFLLNNGYGKFATNPRKFKEHYITDPDERPPESWFKTIPQHERIKFEQPEFEHSQYWIWSKPTPQFTFYNVGVAASITGAARSVLLQAIANATDPIYCDTDSIICRDLRNVPLHKSELGAWDLEDTFKSVAIAGKKLYSVEHAKPKQRSAEQLERGISPLYTVKSKGTGDVSWQEMLRLIDGETISKTQFGPTLTRYSEQDYLTRRISATAKVF